MKFTNKQKDNWELIQAIISLLISIFMMAGAFLWDFSNYKANLFVLALGWCAFLGSLYLIILHFKNK